MEKLLRCFLMKKSGLTGSSENQPNICRLKIVKTYLNIMLLLSTIFSYVQNVFSFVEERVNCTCSVGNKSSYNKNKQVVFLITVNTQKNNSLLTLCKNTCHATF